MVFTTCVQWLAQFIIVYSNPYMMADITYGTFLFFGASLVLGFLVVFFFMPETKGLSLEEMDILFSTKGTAVHMRRHTDEVIAAQREAEHVASATEMTEKAAVHHLENDVV